MDLISHYFKNWIEFVNQIENQKGCWFGLIIESDKVIELVKTSQNRSKLIKIDELTS